MSIDDIDPSADTIMTALLVRLFAAAGCRPTACHACERRIKEGMTFKLVPHNGTDEMCCDRCGEHQLVLRDKRLERRRNAVTWPYLNGVGVGGGFSRPSKAEKP